MANEGEPPKSSRWERWARAVGLLIVAAGVFYTAISLLRQTSLVFKPDLENFLSHTVSGDLEALGAAWLSSYLALNGSVIAATGLAFFDADLLGPSQLLFVIFGSRLGAAGIVVLVGLLDYFRHRREGLRTSTSLGVLAFIVTYLATIPATVLSWVWVAAGGPGMPGDLSAPAYLHHDPGVFGELLARILESVGPVVALAASLGLLMLSLEVFDRMFRRVDHDDLRDHLRPWFRGRWRPFAIGLLLTLLTTSVAFSLGAIVPLYNRNYLRREEMIPYVLGANIGTFSDTLIVALLLARPEGLSITLLALASIFVCTVLALLGYALFEKMAVESIEVVTDSRRGLGVFLVSLALIPLGLVGLGHLI